MLIDSVGRGLSSILLKGGKLTLLVVLKKLGMAFVPRVEFFT